MAGDDNAIDLEGLKQELTEHFMGEDKEEAPPTAHDTPSSTPSATTEQTGEVDAKESNASPASSTEAGQGSEVVEDVKKPEQAAKPADEFDENRAAEAFLRKNPQAAQAIQFGQILSSLPREAQAQVVKILQDATSPVPPQKAPEADPYAQHKQILEEMEITFPGVAKVFGDIIQQNQRLEQAVSEMRGDVNGRKQFEDGYRLEVLRNTFQSQEQKLRTELEPAIGKITDDDMEQIKVIAIGERQAKAMKGIDYVPDIYEIGKSYFDRVKLYQDRMAKRNIINGTAAKQPVKQVAKQATSNPTPTKERDYGTNPYEDPIDVEIRNQLEGIDRQSGNGGI